jgi:phosphinothricin acetyltransferase
MEVRDATADDVPAINALYNALIATTTVAWTEDEEPLGERTVWFEHQGTLGNPVLVAEVDGHVVGFASYDDFRDSTKWPGYRFTVEHTVHVSQSHARAGIGRALLEALMVRAQGRGKHVMVGAVDSDNLDSLRFHERLGFSEVGRLTEIGFKFGRWLDVVFLQRRIDDGDE